MMGASKIRTIALIQALIFFFFFLIGMWNKQIELESVIFFFLVMHL